MSLRAPEAEPQTEGLLEALAVSAAREPDRWDATRPGRRLGSRRLRLVRVGLLLSDFGALLLAFLGAGLLLGAAHTSPLDFGLFALTLPAWAIGAKLYGLYDRDGERPDHTTVDDVGRVFHLTMVGTWLLYAAGAVTGIAHPPVAEVIAFSFLTVGAVVLGRSIARAFIRRHHSYLQNTVVVGAGSVGQLIARKFLLHPEYGINIVGFVDAEARELAEDVGHLALLGPPERLQSIVELLDVERVVIAFWDGSHREALELVRSLKDLDVKIDIAPRLHELIGPSVGIHTVEGFPLVGLPSLRLSRSSRLLKRALDVSVSTLGLLIVSPLLALIALAIKLDSRGPVFFRQVRMGAGDRTFSVLKFRTMALDADEQKTALAHLNKHGSSNGGASLFKIPGDPRVTRVGRFLRRYFLDELPQLFNVVRGEMSLVGPRPLILDEDRHVGEWARRRLDLRPGMTGLWQVLGHSAIPFEEMVKLDYLYVTTWSLRNDIALICRTIPVVLRGGGGAY